MNQQVNFEFGIVKNERLYRFIIEPNTPWDDIPQVLSEFKEHLDLLRQKQAQATQNPEPVSTSEQQQEDHHQKMSE